MGKIHICEEQVAECTVSVGNYLIRMSYLFVIDFKLCLFMGLIYTIITPETSFIFTIVRIVVYFNLGEGKTIFILSHLRNIQER